MASSLDITNAQSSDMEGWTKTSVVKKDTDGVSDSGETVYTNDWFTTGWGYFNENAELKNALILKTIWNVGKGYTTEPLYKVQLDRIRGNGNDTFGDILFNMELMRRVARDSFAEIIRSESGALINLKCLNPADISIVYNNKGIIIRYEQTSKNGIRKYKPHEILHFTNNRLADQIHGISDIESLQPTILAEKESFTDVTKVMHRQAKPFIIFRYKTDDEVKINKTITTINNLREKGEDLHIPDDDNILSYEVVQVNVSQVIMEWRNDIRNKFYRAIGLPQIQAGAGGQGTESDSKVIYLAFEQLVERDQRYIEDQIWAQLGIRINLIPPTSLSANLQGDEAKDAGQGLTFKPSDTTAGVGA